MPFCSAVIALGYAIKNWDDSVQADDLEHVPHVLSRLRDAELPLEPGGIVQVLDQDSNAVESMKLTPLRSKTRAGQRAFALAAKRARNAGA